MVANYAQHSVIDVRAYTLAQLYANNILIQSDYTRDPIFPLQQVPESNDMVGGHAFIVYDFQPMIYYGSDFWVCRDSLTFNIYSNDYGKVLEIQNFLVDLFRRYDLTARDINAMNLSPNKFLRFEVMGGLSPDPARGEDDRYGGSVLIEYDYTREINNQGLYAV